MRPEIKSQKIVLFTLCDSIAQSPCNYEQRITASLLLSAKFKSDWVHRKKVLSKWDLSSKFVSDEYLRIALKANGDIVSGKHVITEKTKHWTYATNNFRIPSQFCPLTHWGLSTPYGDKRSGSMLAQVMACCLTAPSHYLNQCWLIISKIQWHSFEGNFTRDTSAINHENLFENYMSKISLKFTRGQGVNCMFTWAINQHSYQSYPDIIAAVWCNMILHSTLLWQS